MSVPSFPKAPPRGEDLVLEPGPPMESERHIKQIDLLTESLEAEWRDRDDVYIAADMAVYFSETQARKNDFRAPDVFVVLDTQRRERRAWVVWEEDGRTPDLIIELVSDSTEHVDRGIKKDVYARLVHVPIYVIFDPFTARLDVFALDGPSMHYRPLAPDPQGRYWCGRLGVFVAIQEGKFRGLQGKWLRWLRADGTLIKHADERTHDADERTRDADERARDADERARDAETRAALLELELAKLRGEK